MYIDAVKTFKCFAPRTFWGCWSYIFLWILLFIIRAAVLYNIDIPYFTKKLSEYPGILLGGAVGFCFIFPLMYNTLMTDFQKKYMIALWKQSKIPWEDKIISVAFGIFLCAIIYYSLSNFSINCHDFTETARWVVFDLMFNVNFIHYYVVNLICVAVTIFFSLLISSICCTMLRFTIRILCFVCSVPSTKIKKIVFELIMITLSLFFILIGFNIIQTFFVVIISLSLFLYDIYRLVDFPKVSLGDEKKVLLKYLKDLVTEDE